MTRHRWLVTAHLIDRTGPYILHSSYATWGEAVDAALRMAPRTIARTRIRRLRPASR